MGTKALKSIIYIKEGSPKCLKILLTDKILIERLIANYLQVALQDWHTHLPAIVVGVRQTILNKSPIVLLCYYLRYQIEYAIQLTEYLESFPECKVLNVLYVLVCLDKYRLLLIWEQCLI